MESYPKKRMTIVAFKKIVESFLKEMEQLFDCKDTTKQRILEEKYKVRMQQLDYQFYEDQKESSVGKCLNKLTTSF